MNSICLTSAIENRDRSDKEQLEQYILDIAAGNQQALAALYGATRTAVYGFSLSILRNRHDAEDILQETYIRIYGAAANYRPNGNPIPWIFTITRNLALMRLREHGKAEDVPEEQVALFPAEDPAVTGEDKLMLDAAMALLSDAERQIVMLHAVAGLKHREISVLLRLSLPTVLSKYSRALKKLKQKLEEGEQP